MLLSDQYIILAVNHIPSLEHSAVTSRVIIKDMFEYEMSFIFFD